MIHVPIGTTAKVKLSQMGQSCEWLRETSGCFFCRNVWIKKRIGSDRLKDRNKGPVTEYA